MLYQKSQQYFERTTKFFLNAKSWLKAANVSLVDVAFKGSLTGQPRAPFIRSDRKQGTDLGQIYPPVIF